MVKGFDNLLTGDNCTILFFIIVFLHLFTCKDKAAYKKLAEGDCSILFFILVFLLLFSDTNSKTLCSNV